jgi:large subunit ribosomal protein L2
MVIIMGKRILPQRRGRGSQTFTAPTHRRVAPSKYPSLAVLPKDGIIRGVVVDLFHDPGRGAPLALIELENGVRYHTVACEGLGVNEVVEIGPKASFKVGNTLFLSDVPDGAVICNIERKPGDGGKLLRASGSYGIVLAHTDAGVVVKMPSGKTIVLNGMCRATIGVVAGGGRTEKPFLKAGVKLKLMRARGRKYPTVRGVAMAAVYHPHGGGRHQHPGKPTTVSRTAPPGAKVGLIAAKKTGRGARARKTVKSPV